MNSREWVDYWQRRLSPVHDELRLKGFAEFRFRRSDKLRGIIFTFTHRCGSGCQVLLSDATMTVSGNKEILELLLDHAECFCVPSPPPGFVYQERTDAEVRFSLLELT